MITIESERLLLRPVQPQDAEKILVYRSDSEINKYQGWVPNSKEDVINFISKNARSFDEESSWFQFVLIKKDDKELIGDVGVHFMEKDSKEVELGCTINKDYHKKGYAKEALEEMITTLFTKYNKRRITGSVDPRNTSSLGLMKSLNFTQEAHFRKSLFFKGEWVDDVVFALLKEDWEYS